MAGVQVVAVAAEGLGQAADDGRADRCHFNRLAAFGHQGAEASRAARVPLHQPKQAHGRADIDKGPMIGHPVPHGDANSTSRPVRPTSPCPSGGWFAVMPRSPNACWIPAWRRSRYCPTDVRCQSNGTTGYTASWPGVCRDIPPPRLTQRTGTWPSEQGAVQRQARGRIAPAHGDDRGAVAQQQGDLTRRRGQPSRTPTAAAGPKPGQNRPAQEMDLHGRRERIDSGRRNRHKRLANGRRNTVKEDDAGKGRPGRLSAPCR